MKDRRTAYTLLEVMVVMTILASLLLLTAVALNSMYRGTRGIRERNERQAYLGQLSMQLRSDLHQARRAILVVPPASSESPETSDEAKANGESTPAHPLKPPAGESGQGDADEVAASRSGALWLDLAQGKQIQYRWVPAGMRRKVVVDGRTIHQDVFRLRPADAFRFEITTDDPVRVRFWMRDPSEEVAAVPTLSATNDARRPQNPLPDGNETVLVEATVGLLPGITLRDTSASSVDADAGDAP